MPKPYGLMYVALLIILLLIMGIRGWEAEKATERAKSNAQLHMDRAREHYCSAHLPARCEPEEAS